MHSNTIQELTFSELYVFFLLLSVCLSINLLVVSQYFFSADLFEKNPLLNECLQYQFADTAFDLSFKSRDILKELPRKRFPIYSLDLEKINALSLIDIVFAYLYDMRTTCGEHSSESGLFRFISS